MEQAKHHWRSLQTDVEYIGAYSLMDGVATNPELIVTITSISRKKVKAADGSEEECTIALLKDQKPMILNATNQKTMSKLFGSVYVEDWVGKSMILYVARIKAFGDTVDALRVKSTPPVIVLPELTPAHPKWQDAITALKAGNTTIERIKASYLLTSKNEKLLLA